METTPTLDHSLGQNLLVVETQYRERVWGGTRLRAAAPRVGEAWIAFDQSRVANGPCGGKTLANLSSFYPAELLGSDVAHRYGTRFPLLVKFLDSADWLSVQVHPNDEQARRMVGPGEQGKTEAWYFLDVDPGARILAGVKPGTDAATLAASIREERVLDVAEEVAVGAGEAILIPAGTLHAVGPGLLLYEIQQASDTTYRAYDWGRPQSAGRKLHIAESIEVARPVGPLELVKPQPEGSRTGFAAVVSCAYFNLAVSCIDSAPLLGDTGGRSFHIVTAVAGVVELRCGGESVVLEKFATAVIAGAAGNYELWAVTADAKVLRAQVPPSNSAR